VIVAVLCTLALLMGAPLGTLIERSLRTAHGYSLRNYVALASTPANGALPESVMHAAERSLLVASVATLLATGLGLLVAHLATRPTNKGRFLVILTSLPLGASAVMVGLGLLLTLNRATVGFDLRGSWWLLPIGQAVVALPFVARTLLPATRAVDPRLREAASALGARPFAVWSRIDWPLLKRPFGVAVGFAAAMALGEFGATAFLSRPDAPTLPVAIFRLLSRPGDANIGMAFAAAVLLAVVTGGIMAVAERLRPDGEAGL
jgi:thiamine transport system permease protein